MKCHADSTQPGVKNSRIIKRIGAPINPNNPVTNEFVIRSFLFIQIIKIGIAKAITEE